MYVAYDGPIKFIVYIIQRRSELKFKMLSFKKFITSYTRVYRVVTANITKPLANHNTKFCS